jgi:hypothetical protein
MMVMVMGTQRETIEIPSEARTKQRRSSRTSMLTPAYILFFFFLGGGAHVARTGTAVRTPLCAPRLS